MESEDFATKDFEPGEMLWHYTDFCGLKGITDGKIWATSLPYLNDTEEYRYGVSVALEVLDKELSGENSAILALRDSVTDFMLNRYKAQDVFVTSFSAHEDDLSQWRAYGGTGPSFALGFDPRNLETTGDVHHFHLYEVIYDREAIFADIRLGLSSLIEQIREEVAKDPLILPADLARLMGPRIAAQLMYMVPRYKHPKFSSEREWRLIRRQPLLSNEPALVQQYRQSRSLIVPYLELPIHELPDQRLVLENGVSISSPLSAVTIGPSPHRDEVRYSVGEMVSRKGLALIDVSSSKVPFRNW